MESRDAYLIQQDIEQFKDVLATVREQSIKIAAGNSNDDSVRKRLQDSARNEAKLDDCLKILKRRVVDTESRFRDLQYSLLSTIKAEYINIPASGSIKYHMAVLPSELGDAKKRRKKAAAATKKLKDKKRKQAAAAAIRKKRKKIKKEGESTSLGST